MIRKDLRSYKQSRELSIALGGIPEADGSARVSMGDTTVLACVYGPGQPKYSRHEYHDRAKIEIEIGNYSSSDPYQLTEYIRKVIEGTLLLEKYPRMLITIKLLILQNNGALLSTAINSSILALLDACLPMRRVLCAVDLVSCRGEILLDPTLEEENNADLSLSAAFASTSDKIGTLIASELVGECDQESLPVYIENARDYALALGNSMREAVENKYASV